LVLGSGTVSGPIGMSTVRAVYDAVLNPLIAR